MTSAQKQQTMIMILHRQLEGWPRFKDQTISGFNVGRHHIINLKARTMRRPALPKNCREIPMAKKQTISPTVFVCKCSDRLWRPAEEIIAASDDNKKV